MAPYNYILLFTVVLGLAICEVKRGKGRNLIFLGIVSAALIAMGYLRANTVAVDYVMYENYFYAVADGGWDYIKNSSINTYFTEPGYVLINYLVSLVTRDVHVFMGVISLISVGLTAGLVYRRSPSPWMSMMVFISFGFWFNSLNFIRQQLAILIFLFAIEFIQKKKLVPYLLIVVVAALFHNSILIMLPIYFFANLPFNWKTITFYGVGAFILTISTMPIFEFLTQYIWKFYATEEGIYYMRGRDFMTALFPLLLFVAAALFSKVLIRKKPENLVLINLSYYSCLLYLMTLQHFLYQRFGMMFFAVAILLIPEIMACTEPDSGMVTEFNTLMAEGKNSQNLHRIGVLKRQIHDAKWLYWAAIAILLVAGYAYYYFLMDSNRVLLVPYLTWL